MRSKWSCSENLLACLLYNNCMHRWKQECAVLVLDFPTASAVEEDLPWGLEKE